MHLIHLRFWCFRLNCCWHIVENTWQNWLIISEILWQEGEGGLKGTELIVDPFLNLHFITRTYRNYIDHTGFKIGKEIGLLSSNSFPACFTNQWMITLIWKKFLPTSVRRILPESSSRIYPYSFSNFWINWYTYSLLNAARFADMISSILNSTGRPFFVPPRLFYKVPIRNYKISFSPLAISSRPNIYWYELYKLVLHVWLYFESRLLQILVELNCQSVTSLERC